MLVHWETDDPSHRPRVTSNRDLLIATGTFGSLIGLVDFVLFELWGHPSRMLDYVLYKATFISFSSLLLHLILVIGISCVFVGVFILLRLILARLTDKFIGSVPLATLSVALAGLVVASLRLLKESDSVCPTLVSLTSIAFLSVISLVVERRFVGSTPNKNRGIGAAQLVMLIVSVALLTMVFLAPDLHMLLRGSVREAAESPQQRPNVMLIVLDTVRADRLSCYGNTTLTTPNIDRLARGGLLFLNAFSTAPWTIPSHASMFTGLYPSQHQATWDSTYLRDDLVTLAEHLTESGYVTAGFSENPLIGVGNGFAQGFSPFHETWRRPLLERALTKTLRALGFHDELEYAPRTTALLTKWLDANSSDGRPFFAFANLMAAHLPNYPRPGHASTDWPGDVLARIEPVNTVPERYYLPEYHLNEIELRVMADIYDGEISYLDGYVGRVIEFLRESGTLENTIIILTSDHGENFGEHNFIEHQFCLYNTLIHIPLIVHFPQAIKPSVIHERVSNVAIIDTVLDLADIQPQNISERNRQTPLNRIMQDQTIIAEFPNAVEMLRSVIEIESSDFNHALFDRDLRCIFLGDYKYIWSSTGEHELYSMRVDFAEHTNLLNSHQDQAMELRGALDQWSRANQPHSKRVSTPGLDAATRDALRALGYAQ
jgi:arylsulfatase A-like enzyme